MKIALARRFFEWLGKADEEEVRHVISKMTTADAAALLSMFELWAHKAQLPPQGECWRVWLLMAGRGFGKTRAGAEWINTLASSRPGLRIALVGATMKDA